MHRVFPKHRLTFDVLCTLAEFALAVIVAIGVDDPLISVFSSDDDDVHVDMVEVVVNWCGSGDIICRASVIHYLCVCHLAFCAI